MSTTQKQMNWLSVKRNFFKKLKELGYRITLDHPYYLCYISIEVVMGILGEEDYTHRYPLTIWKCGVRYSREYNQVAFTLTA